MSQPDRRIDFVGLLDKTRTAAFCALLGWLLLAMPDQALEVYIIHAQAAAGAAANPAHRLLASFADARPLLQIASGILATALFATVLWGCSMRLLSLDQPGLAASEGRRARLLASAAIGLVPAASLMHGFYRAVRKIAVDSAGAQTFTAEIYWLTILGTMLIGLVLLATMLYFALLGRRADATFEWLFTARGFAVAMLCLVGFVAALVAFPVHLPEILGTLALVSLFLATLTYLLTACACVSFRYRVPVLSAIVVLAVVFSVLGLNDNHRVRHKLVEAKLPGLEQAFADWFSARKDRDHYAKIGAPYPVYLVAAEGGGIYAGYHAAISLARLQDECPGFAQHVFGISSVSGGSLGSAVFAALADTKAKNEAWRPCNPESADDAFRSAVRRYFANDFLSPLVAAALFPDFLQRLLPISIDALDRARALEYAFESAWPVAAGQGAAQQRNPFANPIDALGRLDGATPVLFLNTTAVETGARVTLGPVDFESTPTAMHVSTSLLYACAGEPSRQVELPLSAAVSLSARFPWLTPAGWLERPRQLDRKACEERPNYFGDRLYLVDGGYFENSGLETVLELATRLRRITDRYSTTFPGGVDVRVISISALDAFANRWAHIDADLSATGNGEFVTPVVSLMNTSRARARATNSRMRFDQHFYQYGSRFYDADSQAGRGVYSLMLNGTTFFLPLGWHISALTRRSIEAEKSNDREGVVGQIRLDLAGRPQRSP